MKRFFRNQEGLAVLKVHNQLAETLAGADAVVLAVRHHAHLELDPDDIVAVAGHPIAVIDFFGLLNDDQIGRYFELGCEAKGLDRGHVKEA